MCDYDYANARLRAMKSRLFDRRTYLELAALTRVDDLIAHLAQSTYANEIEAAIMQNGVYWPNDEMASPPVTAEWGDVLAYVRGKFSRWR